MSSTTREIGGHTLDLSNLDKIFFPDADVTKGDLVDYYERVADTMLPHVRDRFISMHRWPDGIDGNDFYQKNAPDHFPGWIRTETVEKEGGTNRQVVIDDPATLVYLADQACVTPHIWLSRAGAPRHPDRMVFDFDPSDDWESSFDAVRWAARRLRALLDEIGLESRVMTSGSRGLHVYVVLDAESDFDEVKDLSRAVAELPPTPGAAYRFARRSARTGFSSTTSATSTHRPRWLRTPCEPVRAPPSPRPSTGTSCRPRTWARAAIPSTTSSDGSEGRAIRGEIWTRRPRISTVPARPSRTSGGRTRRTRVLRRTRPRGHARRLEGFQSLRE